MAKKNTQPDEDIIDLTELIEKGSAGDDAKSASGGDVFEAVFAKTAAGEKEASHVVDPNEELDMSDMGEIDNFLESLEIPSQPGEGDPAFENTPPRRPQAPEKTAKAATDPLDDNMHVEPPIAQAGNKSTDAGKSGLDDLDSALDDLLDGDIKEPVAPQPKKTAAQAYARQKTPPPAEDDLDSALDELLGEDIPSSPSANTKPVDDSMPDLDADLDDILSSFDSEKPAGKQPEPVQGKEGVDADLDDIMAQMDTENTESADAEPVEKESSEEDFDLPADLDAMLDEVETASPAEPSHANKPGMEDVTDFFEEKAPLTSSVSATVQDNESKGSSDFSKDMIAGLCQSILSSQMESLQETLRGFSEKIGGQEARLEEISSNVAGLGKRLIACESKLGAARERIAALETNMGKLAHVEDLLKEGTPLHNGFTALMGASISKAIEGAKVRNDFDQEFTALKNAFVSGFQKLEQRINLLENTEKGDTGGIEELNLLKTASSSAESRLEALEGKIEALESGNSGSARIPEEFESLNAKTEEALQRMEAIENSLEELNARSEEGTGLKSELENIRTDGQKYMESFNGLEERLARLESSARDDLAGMVASLEASQHDAVARMQALEQRVAGLEAVEDSQKDAELLVGMESIKAEGQAAATRLAELGERVSSLEASIESVGNNEEINADIESLKVFEHAIQPRVKALEDKLIDLAAELAKFSQNGIEARDAEIGNVKFQIEELDKRLAEISTSGKNLDQLEADLSAIRSGFNASNLRLENAEKRLGVMEEATRTTPDDGMLSSIENLKETCASLEQKLASMDAKLSETQLSSENMATIKSGLEALHEDGKNVDFRMKGIENRLATFESTVNETREEELGNALSSAQKDMNIIGEKLGVIEERLAMLEKGQPSDELIEIRTSIENLGKLNENVTEKMDSLERQQSQAIADSVNVAALIANLGKLQSEIQSDKKLLAEFSEKIAGITESLPDTALLATIETSDKNINKKLEEVTARLGAVESSVAPVSDLTTTMESLRKAESSLSEKMGNLENSLAELAVKESGKDAMINDEFGSLSANAEEIQARLKAVEERLAGMESISPEEELKASIAGLNLSGKSASARMDSIEKRLDELEPNFNVQVQKAAAAAVARILHEEISKLAGSQ